ncbi:MAG TPA: dihydrolipoyl dehydrogenase [Acidimicrobiales bacterium]|nr:dihydrolipoyl dehydrogenase [Acidimicrobiales bacterium]
MADTHDLVIIGGGPGGYAAALYGAAAGLDVAMIENRRLGGTCLNRGCIPAKELLQTAEVARTVSDAGRFGIATTGDVTLDFPASTDRMWSVVDQLVKGLGSLLKGRKVTVIEGTGTLGPDRTVTVTGADGQSSAVTGENVLLASGSVPRTIPGFEVGDRVLTSDEVFQLDQVPDKVAVIGGGAIGCEFASMLADLGAEVTVLEALPGILPGVDQDVVKLVGRAFEKRGITIRTGVKVEGHEPSDRGTTVRLEGGDTVAVDKVVVSVGRRPLSDSLGLGGTGVEVDDRGFVKVDEWCRTSADGVFAVGDLIATPGLAHVAYAESILVIKQIMGEAAVPVDYGRVPWCVYCHPEVAFVGLTEEAAKAAGHDVVVSKHRWTGNGRAMILGETEGMVKVIAERAEDGTGGRILGVHMAGPWVTEQLGQGYLAVNWEATVDEVAQFIQPHPSLSENFGETVLSLTGRGLHG